MDSEQDIEEDDALDQLVGTSAEAEAERSRGSEQGR